MRLTYASSRSYFQEGELRAAGTNPALYYGTDQIGSVRRVFASTTSAPAYDYDPWGMPLQLTLPAVDFGFAGLQLDPSSQLYLTWYRIFDPKVGRWASRDPAADMTSTNLYSYVDSDPVNFIDNDGKAKKRAAVVPCSGINQSCGYPVRPPGANPNYPNVCYQCLMREGKWPYGGPIPDPYKMECDQ